MFNNFTSEKEYSSCDVVLPPEDGRGALLIGDFNSATSESTLAQYDIKTVITSAAGLDHLQIPSSVTHIVYPLRDTKSQNIQAYFQDSYTTIDRKLDEGGVLVHCAAGISRSATIVIAYIMRKKDINFKAAISLVRSKRSTVCPNLGFQLQLKKYESELAAKPKPPMRKNVSERTSEERKNEIDLKKIDNNSFFDFQPTSSINSAQISRKKQEVKRGVVSRHMGFSKPKERVLVDVGETELFVSGVAAKRPGSQARESSGKIEKAKMNPMLGTWGPKQKGKGSQFEF